MIPRDSTTGAKIIAVREGPFVKIVDDGVDILHLSPSAALLLARQIVEAVTPGDAINTIGGDDD